MRRGELLGLRWEDVKFHLGSVSVQQLGQGDDDEDGEDTEEDDAPVFVPVKTQAGRRSIKLDDVTLGVLKAHRAAQEFERRSWGDGYHDHDLVLGRADGAPHDPDTVSGQFERTVRRSKMKRIRFHDRLRWARSENLQAVGAARTEVHRSRQRRDQAVTMPAMVARAG